MIPPVILMSVCDSVVLEQHERLEQAGYIVIATLGETRLLKPDAEPELPFAPRDRLEIRTVELL